jgi:4-aminobutyrate aminotransferase-like enzyme
MSTVTAELSPEEWSSGHRSGAIETFPPPGESWSGAVAADAVERLANRGIAPAVAYVDGAFTSDGILAPSAEQIQALLEEVHRVGAVFVADEVQAGHGRTGEHLWCFQSFGIVPDVVVLGKPMGNGYPVAAVITRAEIVDRFAERGSFFSTYGGNPVAAAAALAVLDVIEDEGLIEHTARVGQRLRDLLEEIRPRRPAIREVRGRGLMIGVDLVQPDSGEPDPSLARAVANGMRDRGVLIGTTGRHDNVLKVRPPLVFDEEHAGLLVQALDAVL